MTQSWSEFGLLQRQYQYGFRHNDPAGSGGSGIQNSGALGEYISTSTTSMFGGNSRVLNTGYGNSGFYNAAVNNTGIL